MRPALITLTAAQCPAVQLATAFLSVAAAETAANAPTAKNLAIGDSAGVAGKLNENASRLDYAFRSAGMGGAYCVIDGLPLNFTGPSNLARLGTGHSLIEGLVEVATAIPNIPYIGDTYFWLTQAGTIETTTTTAPPPSVKTCYVGTTKGFSVDLDMPGFPLDQSGVLFQIGCVLIRYTADATVPTDTPPGGISFLTQTAGGLYLWDGDAYRALSGAGAGGPVYFGPLPHTSGDAAEHDDWAPDGGVHITATDRSNITGALSAAAAAQSTADDAETTATAAQTTAAAAAALAAAAVQTDDPRLDDAREPLSHAETHYATGSDPIHIDTAQIDDFDTAVAALTIPAGGAAPSHLDVPAYISTDLQYEPVMLGLLPPVVAVATSNVSSLSGLFSGDGLSNVHGYVLLTAQTTVAQNGFWSVSSGGGAWTRPVWYSAGAVIRPGVFCWAMPGGTSNGSSVWYLDGSALVVVDAGASSWIKFQPGSLKVVRVGGTAYSNVVDLTLPFQSVSSWDPTTGTLVIGGGVSDTNF